VEKNRDKNLHDMVQKYSSGEISREQYTHTLGLSELTGQKSELTGQKSDNL
jgi:hypothetical protein